MSLEPFASIKLQKNSQGKVEVRIWKNEGMRHLNSKSFIGNPFSL